MNKRGCLTLFLIALAFAVLRILFGCFFAVYQTEQVIITQFGKPVGEPITDPGLHFKLPIIQEVNRIDKRFLEWDGLPVAIPTRDKTYIHVDTFARWRINDAKTFFVRLRDERSAQSRLEDILGSETRNAVAKNDLIEIIRTDKDRKPLRDENLKNVPTGLGTIGVLPPIQYGRQKIEDEIKAKAAGKLAEFGIELLDVRLKRVNYNPDVLDRIYQRMISERRQIASRFRSEGEGEAARIAGQKERDLNEIQSTAYRQVQQIRGEADGESDRDLCAGLHPESASRRILQFPQEHGDLSESAHQRFDARLFHRQRSLRLAETRQRKTSNLAACALSGGLGI